MGKIILCGMPGCGKTVIGEALARKLGRNHIDTDKLVEEKYNKSCRELYLEWGKQKFRIYESEIIQNVQTENSVISLGGGSLDIEANRKAVMRLGHIVYLECPFDLLMKRKLQNDRPAYAQEFQSLFEMRVPIFQSIQHTTLNVASITIEEAVNHIYSEVCYGH